MKKLILELEDKDFEAIENSFTVIKKGGSKLQTKEDMCILIIKKDTGLTNIIYNLTKNEG